MPKSSKCRLCQCTSSSGIDLFRDCNGSLYSTQIKEALRIELQEIPGSPRKACLTCIVVLQKIFIFRNFVVNNERKLRLQHSQIQPELPEQEPQSTDEANSDRAVQEQVEEEVLEEMDMSNIIEMDAEWMSPLSDSSPGDILESPAHQVSKELDLPIISGQEVDFFSEIIEYDSDSDVIEISDGETPSTPPPDRHTVKTASATPKRTKVKRPKIPSLVRMKASLTDEEERLEAEMVRMGLFVCNVCELNCHTLPELREHVDRLHDSKNYYLCCNRLLRSYHVARIYDHIRWHLNPDAFKCKICAQDYPDSHRLSQHMLNIHPAGPPTYVCEVCGRGFFAPGKLKHHVTIHSKMKCKYCGKELSRNALEIHLKMEHEKELNCLCDICGKGFPTRGRLMSHIMDHGGPHGGRRKKKPKLKISTPEKGIFGDNYFK